MRKSWVIKFALTAFCLMCVQTVTASDNTDANELGDTASIQSGLTLDNCIKIALENNPDIAHKKWDIETSLAEKDIAKGQLWPSISAEAGYSHYLDDQRLVQARSPSDLATFTDDIFSGDIVLRMPLYTSGRLESQVKASEHLTESARHQFARSRKELVFNVSNVFYSILGQKEVVESLVFSQKALEEHLKRVQELLDAQKAARVDLLRTEVRLADIEQNLLRERNILYIQHSLLANLMGVEHLQQSIEIQGRLEPKDFSVDTNQSLALASGRRNDYQAAKARVEAQDKNLDAAKAGHWPIISLEAAYGNRWAAGSTVGGSSMSEDVGRIGVVAVIPLFEGGQINARISRERSRLSAEKEVLRKLQLQIQLEVETAVSNIESTKARVNSIEKAVEQAKESLRIEREKYDLGKGAIVDVLDAQAALLEAQTSFYRALADHNVAIAQWRLAVGEER
ncbi:MAG: TolC family protein [Planctomycetota bacterium]